VVKAFGDDAERQGLDPGASDIFALPVRENAGQLHDFGEPPAIVLALGFDLEGDQVLRSSHLDSTTKRGLVEIHWTRPASAGA